MPRFALHGEITAVLPVYLDVWPKGEFDCAKSCEVRWFSVIERCIDVPSLELGVACSESFGGRWIPVAIVACSAGCCEVLDAVVIFALVALGNKPDVWR